MAGISKYSKAERASFVRQWQQSGQSRMAFSQAHGINYNNFKQWARAHGKPQAVAGPANKELPGGTSPQAFVAIKIDSGRPVANPSVPLMEISFANGSHLSIYQQLPAAYLRELLG